MLWGWLVWPWEAGREMVRMLSVLRWVLDGPELSGRDE